MSGTHFYFGWVWDIYIYNIGTQKITFADADLATDSTGVEYARIEVNCGDEGGQSAWISMSVNFRVGFDIDKNGAPVFSPEKLIALHNDGVGKTYKDVIIKRTVIDVVNEESRPKKALDIYSGQGFVDFKNAIAKRLQNHPVFEERGIFIENVIVYNVALNKEYEQTIEEKQLAIQKKLKELEETKAAEQRALRVFADSQADVEKRTQEAEAAKREIVKAAEAQRDKSVLQAEAEKQKRILEAEGERDANLALASGVLAVGEAEAKVAQMKRDAMYSGEAGMRRATVEIAGLQAEKLRGLLNGVKVITDGTMQVLVDSSAQGIGITVPAE